MKDVVFLLKFKKNKKQKKNLKKKKFTQGEIHFLLLLFIQDFNLDPEVLGERHQLACSFDFNSIKNLLEVKC